MKLPEKWINAATSTIMGDVHFHADAPLILGACLSSLTGGVDPVAHVVQRESRQGLAGVSSGSTTWRALWLTDDLIAFAEAKRAREGWSVGGPWGEEQPDTMAAWVRPVNSVTAVEVVEARCFTEWDELESANVWQWTSTVSIVFEASEPVQLPLFASAPDNPIYEAAQTFQEALLARIGSASRPQPEAALGASSATSD